MAGRILLPSLSGMPRLADASQRLANLVVLSLGRGFAWGVHDCALWAADAIQAQLGRDPAATLRGQYNSSITAARVINRLGGLHGIATAVLGSQLAAPMAARVGDVGLLGQGMLAVCAGETWLAVTAKGLGHLPLADATAAWHVGQEVRRA